MYYDMKWEKEVGIVYNRRGTSPHEVNYNVVDNLTKYNNRKLSGLD